MHSAVIFLIISTAVLAQNNQNSLPCGFSCSRNTVIFGSIDGQQGTASCSQNTNPSRCSGCCIGKALQVGLASTFATGFISNDGQTCVCCFNNNNQNCGGGNVFTTFNNNINNPNSPFQ
ncbi:unnamed protein product [Caenorhabditis angaria]|uniref:Uncharacterized protein n=1 Tax=Caenorhabditis angaria TaxID=860376 RepID=A0A9P1J059_9PELO|nr:unnamed protein product [Caenorhabditis angaria]